MLAWKNVYRCFSPHRCSHLTCSLSFLLLGLTFLSISPRVTEAARNITIDDIHPGLKFVGDEWKRIDAEDPTKPLTVGPRWMCAWVEPGFTGHYNLSYQLTFEFYGTALYLYYPLWTFGASSGKISVDGSDPVIISLRDTALPQESVPAPEGPPPSTMSRIRYSLVGLKQEKHTLLITPDERAAFVAFDALMYTDDEADPAGTSDWSTTMASQTSMTTSTLTSSSTNVSPTAPPSQNRNTATIAAVAVAAVVAVMAIALAVFLFKRCRRRIERYRYPLPGVDFKPTSHTSDADVQPTFISTPRHDTSYQGLSVVSPYSSPMPSPSLFATTTHHQQPSSEVLLPSESSRMDGRLGTLRVTNDTNPIADARDGSAPPAYETLEQTPPPIHEKPKPVTLRYPGDEGPSSTLADTLLFPTS
ncbi:hypothetical protein NMY22_g5889 [Coprinellus aureogranulatus]|nr:hypothetical protein NMY22_g5889 [Coprinellus aureogranulatus]